METTKGTDLDERQCWRVLVTERALEINRERITHFQKVGLKAIEAADTDQKLARLSCRTTLTSGARTVKELLVEIDILGEFLQLVGHGDDCDGRQKVQKKKMRTVRVEAGR